MILCAVFPMTFISNRAGQRSSSQPAPAISGPALSRSEEPETELNEVEAAFQRCYQRFTGNVPSHGWRTPDHFYEDSHSPWRVLELNPMLAIFLLGTLGVLMVQVGRYLEAARQPEQAIEASDDMPAEKMQSRSQESYLAVAPPEHLSPEFSTSTQTLGLSCVSL
jgi:hypothetical protein